RHAHATTAHLDGVEMEDQRTEDGENALAVRVGGADTEHRLPDLRIDDAVLKRAKISHSLLDLDERFGIRPLTAFLVELLRLVDDDLAVREIDEDLGPLQRPRRRAFEVDAGLVVAAAVAGALELVLRREPVGGTPEVREHGDERVHGLLGAHDPDAVLLFPALVDLADGVVGGEAGLELLDRLKE